MGISVDEVFKLQRILLMLAGFWPRRNSSIYYQVYGMINYALMASFGLSLILSTLVVTEFSQIVQACAMFVTMLNSSIKLMIFFVKMPTFLNLADFLRSQHFSYHTQNLDHYLQRSIKITAAVGNMFFCSGMTTYVCLEAAPLFASKGSRVAPFPFPLHLKEHSSTVYFLVYTFQLIALFSAALLSIGFDILSTGIMGLCSAYFAILRKTITSITHEYENNKNEADNMKRYKKFDEQICSSVNECVSHHLAVIKFAEYIEDIFSYAYLSQFLCSAGGICLVGVTFMNTEPGSIEFIFALSYLATLMFQITLYCAFGNEVTIQSSLVLDACYMTEWIYCGPQVRQNLFIIMERAKRPMVLTAGKFLNLSLTALVAILKSAGSYAMVLIQLYNK